MLIEDIEGIHRNNIHKLMDSYGREKEQEIKGLYEEQRQELQSIATIQDHIPFFTYQQTEKILRDKYGKPIIKKDKSDTSEQQEQQQPQLHREQKRSRLLRLLIR